MEKDLQSKEALEKFKSLVNDIRVCMYITDSGEEKDHSRPMATIEVDDDGSLWFFTDKRSVKVEESAANKTVHLVYAHPGKESYLDVWGRASVTVDQKMIGDKWTPMVKAYFPDGKTDPNLALLKVSPLNIHYWDAETGKMAALLKMAASVVTGERLVEGKQGDLQI